MAEQPTPENVLEALAEVRESGRTNMLDRAAVARLAGLYGYHSAAAWLYTADTHNFIAALKETGRRCE